MSEYCKAYPASHFREFAGWTEDRSALQPELREPESQEDESAHASADGGETRTPGADEVLFLHDNYRVTGGIFVDEQVVFDADTPEWRRFCHEVLAFEVPDYVRDEEVAAPAATSIAAPEGAPDISA